MILLEPPIIFTTPAKLSSRRPFLTSAAVRCSSITKPECSAKASFKCSCKKNGKSGDDFESFSVLVSDIPWDDGSTWSTMALYFFSLHIPLSFGALSLVARMLHQTILDLQTEEVNNPILKEILLSGNVSEIACFIVYCIVAPLLEETVYRGFLLTSIASKMKWQHAVVISSAIFSLGHFSGSETVWLLSLFQELSLPMKASPKLLCDNLGATHLSFNLVQHFQMKHIQIDLHFVCDMTQRDILNVHHVNTQDQLADLLTKSLSRKRRDPLKNKIGLADGSSILRGRIKEDSSNQVQNHIT
ncbi:uncharacterized protein LOC131148516 isoform X3 [Malania oleifera]|uniref:uncharacterized protein LOC131148516 isoform X3 n=1 Tax=Malania oleifera TaxID=397392 RepID=UPI0025ADD851|nr:uncharacterized protein LOC131148516 isoform X3 [Malania oleifera]